MSRAPLRRLALGAGIAAVVVLPAAAPASAATGDGCRGVLSSYSADGSFIDLVLVPSVEGSQRDPFRIDPDGFVAWGGSPTSVMHAAAWSLSMMGVDVASGSGIDAPDGMMTAGIIGRSDAEGSTVSLRPLTTAAVWALRGESYFPVTFTLSGATSSCTATVWVGGVGEPSSSPVLWAALVTAMLGVIFAIAMMLTTRRRSVIDLRDGTGQVPVIRPAGAASTPEGRLR